MRNNGDRTSKGLNQILEIINAKGDQEELQKIVENTDQEPEKGVAATKQKRSN